MNRELGSHNVAALIKRGNCATVTQIYIHIVFSTKDRKPWLRNEGVRAELYAYMAAILRDRVDSPAIIVNGVADHVHSLIRLSRKFPVMKILQESYLYRRR